MEKSRLNFLVMFAALSLLAISCKRSGSESSKSADTRIQPGGTSEESEDSGYLALKILKVHEGREPLDRAPWHGPGGDWTFVECEPIKARGLRVVIGARTQKEESRGEFSFGWGRGMLALANSTDAPRFVEVFAKAFHQKLPPSHGNTPAGLLKVNTAVLGSNLLRDREGGFKSGSGTWTATKWFLEDENTGEAEVFFNYNLSEKRAEFSEKDEDYREPLIELLTVALRDGPLPERTPENDPNLTLAGPRVSAWTRIADKNANCQFTPDSRNIVVTETSTNGASQLFLMSAAGGSERQSLAKFDGAAAVHEFVDSGERLTLFVTETLRRNVKTFSSADPQRLWFVAENQKRELPVRADLTNWHVTSKCVSPDASFVALHAWITQPNKKRARVIYMANVRSGEWRTIEKPNTALQLVGWTNGNGVVLTGTGFDKGESRNAYTLKPRNGPVDAVGFASGRVQHDKLAFTQRSTHGLASGEGMHRCYRPDD